jgi:hypothetical protein
MASGSYSATITITDSNATNSPLTIPVTVSISQGNVKPLQPVITSPYPGELEVDPLVRIETEPFSDPDAGDIHSKSHWKIIKQQDSTVVLDVTSSKHLTELPVPHAVLDR